MTDPVIVYRGREDLAPPEDHRIYDDIRQARLEQVEDIPIEERIEYATWPEATVYLSTLTMDERFVTEPVKELYQYSFHQYIEGWVDQSSDLVAGILDGDVELSGEQRDRMDDLRFGVKKDRDKYFIDREYDELAPENVPPEFWLTSHEISREQETLDDMAQSAVDEYGE